MSRLIKTLIVVLASVLLSVLLPAVSVRAEYCMNYSKSLQGFISKYGNSNTRACWPTREACEAYQRSNQYDSVHKYDFSGGCYQSGAGSSSSGGGKGSSNAVNNMVKQTVVEGVVGGVLGNVLNPPAPKNPQTNVQPTAGAIAQQKIDKQQKQAQDADRQAVFSDNQQQLLSNLKGGVTIDKPSGIDLKMPPENEDARKKQLAQCPGISAKITEYENGIRHIDEVMAHNDRFIRGAQEDGKRADEDLSKVKADAAAETLSMGLKSFMQTQKNLQSMRNALDKLQAGTGGNAGTMSYDQIVQAKKWLDKGLTHGQDVIDLTQKSLQYNKSTSLRGNGAPDASPYSEKLKTALRDFNDKFMYDAGGWEFVGEHLAEAGGGTAGEIAFKTAVAGIKATAAGIGMKLSEDQLRVYNENQDKMALERDRLEQRIGELKTTFINNRCPKK